MTTIPKNTPASFGEALAARYMRARLRHSTPLSNPRLTDAEDALATSSGANKGNLSVTARKIYEQCPTVSSAIKLVTQCTSEYRSLTMRMSSEKRTRNPDRLVSTRPEKLNTLLRTVGKAKRDLADTLDGLDETTYRQEILAAQTALGNLSTQVEWLSLDELKERFELKVTIDPLPSTDPTQFGDNVEAAIAMGLIRAYQKREQVFIEAAFDGAVEALCKDLETYVRQLHVDGRLYESVRERILEALDDDLLDLAARCECGIEDDVEAIRQAVDPEVVDLRDKRNAPMREATLRKVQDVLERVKTWREVG